MKSLIEENIPGVVIYRPPNRRQSDQISLSNFQCKALDEAISAPDKFSAIYKTAKLIRNELLNHRSWKFDGDFSDFDIPDSLSVLLRWLIVGPQLEIDSTAKEQSVNTIVNNISQIIIKATKSNRQVRHKELLDADFREVVETPFQGRS